MSCGVGHRHGLDPTFLWLWRRPVAMAPIRLLAWEPPYAEGAALEKAKRQTNKQANKQKTISETAKLTSTNVIGTWNTTHWMSIGETCAHLRVPLKWSSRIILNHCHSDWLVHVPTAPISWSYKMDWMGEEGMLEPRIGQRKMKITKLWKFSFSLETTSTGHSDIDKSARIAGRVIF